MRRFALASVLALAACSSGSSDTTSSSSSSSGSSGASGTSSASSTGGSGSTGSSSGSTGGSTGDHGCNELSRDGAVVNATATASAAPAAQGGAIADGTYDLTALTVYTGAGGQAGPLPGQTEQETVSFSGNFLERNYSYNLLGNSSAGIESDEYVLSGVQFAGTSTCPPGGVGVSGSYTATATTLTLFSVTAGRTVSAVYTHR